MNAYLSLFMHLSGLAIGILGMSAVKSQLLCAVHVKTVPFELFEDIRFSVI